MYFQHFFTPVCIMLTMFPKILFKKEYTCKSLLPFRRSATSKKEQTRHASIACQFFQFFKLRFPSKQQYYMSKFFIASKTLGVFGIGWSPLANVFFDEHTLAAIERYAHGKSEDGTRTGWSIFVFIRNTSCLSFLHSLFCHLSHFAPEMDVHVFLNGTFYFWFLQLIYR